MNKSTLTKGVTEWQMIEERKDSLTIKHPPRLQFCWLTGYTQNFRPRWWSGPWWLQIAHLGSGSGSMHRVDDRRAVVLLCPLAHDLHVADRHGMPTKRIGRHTWPTIDASNLLWIKRAMDPAFFDLDYISTIWVGSPPRPIKPDELWVDMLHRHKGLLL